MGWARTPAGSPPCAPTSPARATGWSPASTDAGYVMLPSAGTYFVSIDLAASGIALDDVTVADRLLDAGVATIPVSAFYAEDPVTSTLRLCFAKRNEVLDSAIAKLAAARRTLV